MLSLSFHAAGSSRRGGASRRTGFQRCPSTSEPDAPVPGLHDSAHLAGDGARKPIEKMHEVVQRTGPNYYNMANPIELTSDLVLE